MLNVFLTVCFVLIFAAPVSLAQQQRNAPLTRAQIKEAEQHLASLGYWTGSVDGVFDVGSRQALIAFQKWEGRPVTGKLSVGDLEALRSSETPKPRDPGYEHVEVDIDRQILMLVREDGGVRILPTSTGDDATFISDGQESVAYTPRGRFVVYDKTFGWENGALGSVYYANYISGGVAIHGYETVPKKPASHGCIRIPMFAARAVSKLLPLGTIVLVYDKVSFVSAKDWAQNPALKQAAMLNGAAPDYIHQPDTKSSDRPPPRP
jgi:peptidoglycan hydrolase-like protein with peptidoglycan-binding domain